jgi:hypothetical protein
LKIKLQVHNETNNLDDTAYKANAFALTFAFATTHRQTQQKQKRVQATAPVHRRPDRKQRGQFSVYSTTTTLRTDRRAADNSTYKKLAAQCFV